MRRHRGPLNLWSQLTRLTQLTQLTSTGSTGSRDLAWPPGQVDHSDHYPATSCYYCASTGSADLACPPGQFDHHDYYCYYYVSTGSSGSRDIARPGSTASTNHQFNWVNWVHHHYYHHYHYCLWVNLGPLGSRSGNDYTEYARSKMNPY